MTNDYLHRASIGDDAGCHRVKESLVPALDGAYDAGRIRGYLVSFVEDAEGAVGRWIPDDCLELTAGRYPFLYLRVNFPDGSAPDAGTVAAVAAAGFELFQGGEVDDEE